MIDGPIGFDQRMRVSGTRAASRDGVPQSRTTLPVQALILLAMVALPLENNIPTVAGMSSTFLIFATLGIYVVVNRPHQLSQVWLHPVFIAAYVFLGVSVLLEFSSPLARYDECLRFGYMIGGAMFLSVLCSDRSGLTVGLYGYIAAALWVALYLYLTSYGMLSGMGQTQSFHEASKVRAQAFGDKSLAANINAMAFTCTQGAVVAFAFALAGKMKHRRIVFLGIAMFCLVASFLPMSRGAAIITLVSFTVVLYAFGFKHGKALILVSMLGLTIYGLVPEAVWSRMSYSTESRSGKLEGRAHVYSTALNRLPDYVVAGVGAGNFWRKWGFEKGFNKDQDGVQVVFGAHNSLLQIMIYWGIIGLFLYLMIIWCIYRAIPWRCGRDALSLALLAIISSLGLWMLESHGFYDKWFACGIGMLIGARQWIWPTGIVSAAEVKNMTVERSN